MRTTLPTWLVESPVLRNGHAGFGGRPEETDWTKDQHRASGRPNVVLTDGNEHHLHKLRDHIADVLAPMGLVLSPPKTRIVHMSEGFEFLGFRIQWARKRGTSTWHVYTFPADRALASVKTKIKALTPQTSQAPLEDTLIRINQISRGWTNYFRHAVASRTFNHLHQYTWWRIVRWQRTQHRWNWSDIRRWLTLPTGRWVPIRAGETVLFDPTRIAIRRYRYRGAAIPNPFQTLNTNPTTETVESPVR